MITIKQIEEKMLAERQAELKATEDAIDRELFVRWSRGERRIHVSLPGVHRLVLDELVSRYRAGHAWAVELTSSTRNSVYDGLSFSEYRAPVHSEL